MACTSHPCSPVHCGFLAPLAVFSRMNQRYHILHVNQTNCSPSQDLICCYRARRPTALLTSKPILQKNEVAVQITTTCALENCCCSADEVKLRMSTSFIKKGVFSVLLAYLNSWSAVLFCLFFFLYTYNCVSVELIQLFTSWIWKLIASSWVLIKAFVTEDKLSVPALSKVWSNWVVGRSQKNSVFFCMEPKSAGSTQPCYAITQTQGQGNRSVALQKWSRCCTKDLALCCSLERVLGGRS